MNCLSANQITEFNEYMYGYTIQCRTNRKYKCKIDNVSNCPVYLNIIFRCYFLFMGFCKEKKEHKKTIIVPQTCDIQNISLHFSISALKELDLELASFTYQDFDI